MPFLRAESLRSDLMQKMQERAAARTGNHLESLVWRMESAARASPVGFKFMAVDIL